MNAKMMARDREEHDRARLHDRAQALMQLAEHPMAANNPSMKAALTEAAFSAWDEADAGPAKKGTKQHGLGALMKRMVGAGGYNPAPPQGPGPMRTMLDQSEKNRQAEIQKEHFEAPDRGDYGSSGLQNFLGPAATNPVSTQTPDAGMSRDRAPGLSMTPEENMSHAAPPPAPVAQYAQQPRTQSPVQASATANYANNVISPDKLIRSATVAHTGKYGFQDTAAIQRDVQIQAQHIINDLLDHVDSFIDVTPGHETLEEAYAHPQIRQALDGIRQYSHLTGQKFEDIVGGRFAKKDDQPTLGLTTIMGPDGKPVLANHNPHSGAVTPVAGGVTPYEKTSDPTSIAEYNLYAKQEQDAGRIPDSFKDWSLGQHPVSVPSAVGEYNFYAQQEQAAGRKPLSFDQWQSRDANRKNPQPKFDDLEKYRITAPGSTSFSPDKGFQQTQGGSSYDVGGLIDAINHPERTGMTIERVQSAWQAYPEGADKAALGQVLAAFNRKAVDSFH